jgi:hypothetical protein
VRGQVEEATSKATLVELIKAVNRCWRVPAIVAAKL